MGTHSAKGVEVTTCRFYMPRKAAGPQKLVVLRPHDLRHRITIPPAKYFPKRFHDLFVDETVIDQQIGALQSVRLAASRRLRSVRFSLPNRASLAANHAPKIIAATASVSDYAVGGNRAITTIRVSSTTKKSPKGNRRIGAPAMASTSIHHRLREPCASSGRTLSYRASASLSSASASGSQTTGSVTAS